MREGRHPVVEAAIGRGAFVPNDCVIDPKESADDAADRTEYGGQVDLHAPDRFDRDVSADGKLCALPAKRGSAWLIVCLLESALRDSLARGESTFMIEMKETAAILEHATQRSLILSDEVGRGTSTFDGISIAWAVAESLHERAERPRTLFATHYHELTDLAADQRTIKNYNFAVKEWQRRHHFFKKPGGRRG